MVAVELKFDPARPAVLFLVRELLSAQAELAEVVAVVAVSALGLAGPAAGTAGAAGLAAVRDGAGPGSRRGACEPSAGAGSQSCTMENCIFVKMSARLCSCEKNLRLFPYAQFLMIERKAAFFLFHFPDAVLEGQYCRMDKEIIFLSIV